MTDSEYRRLVEFLGERFTEIDSRFVALEGRFATFERRSEEQFREIPGHFDELDRRLDRLETESFAIVQSVRRIEILIGTQHAPQAA
jgi:hypothetical protein